MPILSKACKSDNFESDNSLRLRFMNTQGLRSNVVDCESFLEQNSPRIIPLWETNLDESSTSDNFSVRGIGKDSSTHMHGHTIYVKEGPPFGRELSLENCKFLFIFSTGFISLSTLLLFPLFITFFVFVHGF